VKKDPKPQSRASTINLFGGALCLDFANTVDWRLTPSPEEILTSYRDLVDWSRHAGIIDGRRAARLVRRAGLQTANASCILRQAVELRETVYEVFVAVARGRSTGQTLPRLNRALSPYLARSSISPARQGFVWTSGGDPDEFDSILWPIAWSAAELLTSQDVRLVRECLGAGCGWLFLDKSRSHRRRWCDMKGCGNRAKARRYYERLKSNK
jgi:predicted RNA-binding Zn ribbon-like protein